MGDVLCALTVTDGPVATVPPAGTTTITVSAPAAYPDVSQTRLTFVDCPGDRVTFSCATVTLPHFSNTGVVKDTPPLLSVRVTLTVTLFPIITEVEDTPSDPAVMLGCRTVTETSVV